MNELAGFSLQPSQIPLPVVVAVGKWEAHFSFPLSHGLLCSAADEQLLVVTQPVMQQRPDHRQQLAGQGDPGHLCRLPLA